MDTTETKKNIHDEWRLLGLRPDPEQIRQHLLAFAPEGPWHLVAIDPEKREKLKGEMFDSVEAAIEWAVAKNERFRNVYFTHNRLLRQVRTKPSRKDIASMDFLHADIDPRAGHDLAEEQARIGKLFGSCNPRPTIATFSGGGFQAFWRLNEPVDILGEEPRWDEAALYNRQLQINLGGTEDGVDNTQNVDRIMRVAGTINWPDHEKRTTKGRAPAMAELLWTDGPSYSIDQFQKAPKEKGRKPRSKKTAAINRNADPVTSLDGLDLPDRVKVAIIHGRDPEDPQHWPSRSEALWFALCEMARRQIPADTMFGIIALGDSDWGVVQHVHDQGDPEGYAEKQIEKAQAETDDDPVSEINREYFAVLDGGKAVFCREEADGTLTTMDKSAFDYELADRVVMANDKPVAATKLWHCSGRRRYYRRGFVLDPQEGHDPAAYNLWRGFGVDPAPGEWPRLRAHVGEVLAEGNSEYADYVLRWSAWSLQNPATPPRVALVFRGNEGVGKGVFCNALVRAFGSHGMRLQHMQQVSGRFNAHMRHLCMLFADEAVVPGLESEGILKGMITEAKSPIEAKGRDIVVADNHLHVVMASNSDWVVPAGDGARRFAVFDVPATYKGQSSYFGPLWSEIENGGLAAMMHEMLNWDLGSWHPESARPETVGLVRQKIASLGGLDAFWFECLQTGNVPLAQSHGESLRLPTTPFANRVSETTKRQVSANEVQRLLGDRFGFEKYTGRPRGWVVPPLPQARATWDANVFEVAWDDAEEWHVYD